MPTISIVVPVYNSGQFLERCLDSLQAMTFEDFEVIVVDDGSEDHSWSIVERYARGDVRFSRSFQAPHSGLGPTRNRGLEIATGEFVTFVDSDDHVDPDFCRAPWELAREQEADLVLFGSWWDYPDHQELHQPTCTAGMSPREALLKTTPMAWDKLYRRDFLLRWNLRFPAICHEDEVFTPLLMARAPRIAVLQRPLYHYVRREGSITGLGVNPNSMDVLEVFRLVIDQSRTLPEFRHELEHHAVRVLRWNVSRWQACNEAWAGDCLRRSGPLLDAIDHPGSDNPYLLRERRDRERAWRRNHSLSSRFRRLIGSFLTRCKECVPR